MLSLSLSFFLYPFFSIPPSLSLSLSPSPSLSLALFSCFADDFISSTNCICSSLCSSSPPLSSSLPLSLPLLAYSCAPNLNQIIDICLKATQATRIQMTSIFWPQLKAKSAQNGRKPRSQKALLIRQCAEGGGWGRNVRLRAATLCHSYCFHCCCCCCSGMFCF